MGARHGAAVYSDPPPVAGDQDVGALLVLRKPREFGDLEASLLQDDEEIVWEIDVGLVQFIDQQHTGVVRGGKCGAQRSQAQEVPDVRTAAPRKVPQSPGRTPRGPRLALQRRLTEPPDRVVPVQSVRQRGAAVDGPAQHVT